MFIADGYTLMGTIDGCELHPPLAFEYRPMLRGDRVTLLGRMKATAAAGEAAIVVAERIALDELARRIVSCTVGDGSVSQEEVLRESLGQFESHLLAKLANIVFRFRIEEARADAADERNLIRGIRLLLVAPHLAVRDCNDCQRHVYDERTGRRQIHGGRPVVRPSGTSAPCRLPYVGCLKGTPEDSNALSARNVEAYRHYRECRAVGAFPDDPIVRRNAVIIRAAERERERRAASAAQSSDRRSAP